MRYVFVFSTLFTLLTLVFTPYMSLAWLQNNSLYFSTSYAEVFGEGSSLDSGYSLHDVWESDYAVIYRLEITFERYNNLFIFNGDFGIDAIPIPEEADIEYRLLLDNGLVDRNQIYYLSTTIEEIFKDAVSDTFKEHLVVVSPNTNILMVFLKPGLDERAIHSELESASREVAQYLRAELGDDSIRVHVIYYVLPFQPYYPDLDLVVERLSELRRDGEVPVYVGAVGQSVGAPIIQVSLRCGWEGVVYNKPLTLNQSVLDGLVQFTIKVFGEEVPVYVEVVEGCPLEEVVPLPRENPEEMPETTSDEPVNEESGDNMSINDTMLLPMTILAVLIALSIVYLMIRKRYF